MTNSGKKAYREEKNIIFERKIDIGEGYKFCLDVSFDAIYEENDIEIKNVLLGLNGKHYFDLTEEIKDSKEDLKRAIMKFINNDVSSVFDWEKDEIVVNSYENIHQQNI